jgi:hypothetical protein
MKRILLLASALWAFNVSAQVVEDAKDQAVLDVTSIAIGLALGATELNPLGLVLVAAKYGAHSIVNSLPPAEQPEQAALLGSISHGASSNNWCIIVAILSGGSFSPACPLVGLVSGMTYWNRNSKAAQIEAFNIICKNEQLINPALECTFTRE